MIEIVYVYIDMEKDDCPRCGGGPHRRLQVELLHSNVCTSGYEKFNAFATCPETGHPIMLWIEVYRHG